MSGPHRGGDFATPWTYAGPADPTTLATVRRLVRNWLASTVDLDAERVSDIVLATDEALSNCVDHAYRDSPGAGAVILHAGYDRADAAVTIRVTDHGCWTHPYPPELSPRGRGFTLMHALADACTVHGRPDGTTVRLRFHDCPGRKDASLEAG